MKKARNILIIILFVVIFGIIGKMDSINEQRYYEYCQKTYTDISFLNN